jgi:DNA-binding response OmpR family regulator
MPQPPQSIPERTILLLEGDDDLRQQHALYLGVAGFHVLESRLGAEAVPLAQRYAPQIILADLSASMALHLAAVLNPNVESPTVPIVGLCDGDEGMLMDQAASAGIEWVLPRECALPDLLIEIQTVLAACQIWRSYAAVVRERADRARTASEALLERSRQLQEKFEYLRQGKPPLRLS